MIPEQQRPENNGIVTDVHPVAVILIDVINHFDFPDGEALLANAQPLGPTIRELKNRARVAGIPTIYVNDNFGRWQSNFSQILEYCLGCRQAVRDFVEQVKPEEDDYLVLKPKHSGFYQTPLDLLLKHLGTKRLILAGLATNSCVHCTANDAYMRDLELVVPRDCCAARSEREHESAIEHMESMLGAVTLPFSAIDWDKEFQD
jgi:nicotinamidase-related amidase